jgi:transcriptional regulator NrdR family protein
MAGGVRCPECQGTQTEVIDSRPGPNKVHRRRQCTSCLGRFSTAETVIASRVRLTRKQALKQREMGLTYKQIAARSGVSITTVWHMCQ